MAEHHTDPSAFSDEMYRIWEKSMTEWWDQALSSNAFLKGFGDTLSHQNAARERYEQSVDASLTQMHLPTRSDLTQLARISTLLEERLLQQEDLLLELRDRMAALEKETLQARIEATEARLEARNTEQQLQGQLQALQAKLDAMETRPARSTRTKKAKD